MRLMFVAFSIAMLTILANSQTAYVPKKEVSAQSKGGTVSPDVTSEKLAALDKRVADLESQLAYYKYLIDQEQLKHDSIELDPSNHAFQRLDSDTATFLVSAEDASPYLNGYRLKVSIGNPTNAKFSGVKVKIRWARAYDFNKFSQDSYKKWQDSIREKEVALSEDLMPGVWNNVDLDLVPSASDELGFWEMSINSPSVVLRTH